MKASICLLVAIAILHAMANGSRADEKTRIENVDIVIYGGTSSGIVAAIQAKQMGKSVVLIEPSNHLGGLTTGGLGATDIGNKQAIGGLARDFYHRIWQHYQNDAAWVRETQAEYNKRNPRGKTDDKTMWTFEPHVATKIYREMLAEAKIEPAAERAARSTARREEKRCAYRIDHHGVGPHFRGQDVHRRHV